MAGSPDYQLLFPDEHACFQAVKQAAFAQGYGVYRSKATREKRAQKGDPKGPVVWIEIICKHGGNPKTKVVGL